MLKLLVTIFEIISSPVSRFCQVPFLSRKERKGRKESKGETLFPFALQLLGKKRRKGFRFTKIPSFFLLSFAFFAFFVAKLKPVYVLLPKDGRHQRRRADRTDKFTSVHFVFH
ncbi:MAG: hypothetical protein IJQ31_03335 [Thermoguttaceae bacterium]|nr:hypothetical protein [Thermoguttaceae bacterium]